jgi:ADP-ribosylglycohydrolase
MDRPLANSYWVLAGKLLAGEYPLGRERKLTDAGRARVQALLAAGITCFIDLTEDGECPRYDALLPATVAYLRRPITDHGVPRERTQMRRILDEIEAALAAGRSIYLHCRAGIGRTGTAAGCLLIEQGRDGAGALRELNELWRLQCARAASWPEVPQTVEQADYIRSWQPLRSPGLPVRPAPDAIDSGRQPAEISDADLAPVRGLRERFQGALQGLALGDALAAATQFRRPGSFAPVGDLLGGGPFDLPRGAWSDDTAMALCLAESLTECGRFETRDQLARYTRWQREGHLSATGQCLGITAGTAQALAAAQSRRRPFAGKVDPAQRPPEALARVAPVVLHSYSSPEQAVELAADAARTTCRSPLVLDACRLLAAMLHAALRGSAREQVLAPSAAIFGARPLKAEVAAIATRPCGEGVALPDASGDVLAVLELARWCFGSTSSFRAGALRAANLGGNSDVIGAVYGQLAGAHYGVGALPRGWRQALAQPELIAASADALLRDALLRLGEPVSAS